MIWLQSGYAAFGPAYAIERTSGFRVPSPKPASLETTPFRTAFAAPLRQLRKFIAEAANRSNSTFLGTGRLKCGIVRL